MEEGASSGGAAPVSMADTARRRALVREEGDAGMGRRPGAAGLGPAGARVFFNTFRGKMRRKINKSQKNIK